MPPQLLSSAAICTFAAGAAAFTTTSPATFLLSNKPRYDYSRPMYFDFHDDHIVIPQARYDDLIRWTFDGESMAPPIECRPSTLGHGYGLYATGPVSAGEIVFRVPDEKCLTLPRAWAHPNLGESLRIMTGEHDGEEEEGPIAALASFLAAEMLREQCAEWEMDESLRGEYSPYLCTLPTGRGVSEQDHILWWSESEVTALFKGGKAHEKALTLRQWVEEEGEDVIMGMLVSDLASRGMGLSVSQVRSAITTAFVNVLTRSLFGDAPDARRRMVPVLDMAQHAVEPNLDVAVELDRGVVVRAKRDLRAGEELTIDYYSTLFEGHEFYVMFGFIPNAVEAVAK